MNEIQVTLRGNVATEPRQVRFDDGNILTSFRLASTVRRYDRRSQEWEDRGTTYVNVTCRRAMAVNAAASVRKGQPMVVTGTLTHKHWSTEERSGQTLEIQAEGLGHDLSFGTAQFARIARTERLPSPIDVSALPLADDEDQPETGGGPDDVVAAEGAVGPDRGAAMDACEVVDGTEVMDEGADRTVPDRGLDLSTAG